jgi:cytoskeletal protein CcmA (bactofilin family)
MLMFFKSKRKPASNTAAAVPLIIEPSYVSRNTTIEGHLVSDGELHIDGSVRGRLRAQLCVIDRYGVVYGDITGEIIHIRGRVMGPIQGGAVYIYAGAHIEGDVYNDTISVEPGAYVDGAIRHNPQILQNQFRTAEVSEDKAAVEIDGELKSSDADRQKLRVISSSS